MAIKYMMPAYQIGLNTTPTESWPEAASQTFKKGALLVPSSGFSQEAGANPTTVLGVALIAGQNNAANAAVKSQYCPALPHQVFEATLDDAGASPYTSAAGDLGTTMGVTKDGGTGNWFVDHAKNAANQVVQIIGFKDPVGTSQARVYVIFKNSKTAFS